MLQWSSDHAYEFGGKDYRGSTKSIEAPTIESHGMEDLKNKKEEEN